MKLVDVICLYVILALFSSAFVGMYSQILKLDSELEVMRKKTDSLIFISESFCNSCQGKGFSSFDEWKRVCAGMWKLEKIEWKYLGKTGENDDGLWCGKWEGPYGSGEVYGSAKK